MDIQKRLEVQARDARKDYNEFFLNPRKFLEQQAEFYEAYKKHSVAQWAVGTKLSSSHEVAKKIIDSIQ